MAVPGRELPDNGRISISEITPDYYRALRIPLRSGRFFAESDRTNAPSVAIINESAAKKYFPGENPIGRMVTFNKVERTIVGVVGDVHQSSLETKPRGGGLHPHRTTVHVWCLAGLQRESCSARRRRRTTPAHAGEREGAVHLPGIRS